MSLFSTNFHDGLKLKTDNKSLQIRSASTTLNAFSFQHHGEVARIDADGIMRFSIDANDENAAKFIACIEAVIGRRVTGVVVDSKQL